jgi:phage terminase large subunit-like protein
MVIPKTHPAEQYIADVVSGKVISGELVRLACQRHVNDLKDAHLRGLRFDRLKSQRVIDFFSFLRHSKGEWAGKQFTLEPWQQAMTWILFGWVRSDTGFRRFRTAVVELARKNGKSTWAAGIALYLTIADGEPGAEIYSVAVKKEQARLVHGEATRMVAKSLGISKVLKRGRDNLHCLDTNSKFEPLASEEDSLDGLNPHGVIADEVHAWKNRLLWDVLFTAMGARRQPLLLAISTAGYDRNSVFYQQHDYSLKVLAGIIADDSWFVWITSLDEKDDWEDEATWAKSNPNLGTTIRLDELRAAAAKAKASPAELNSFLRLRLNQWTSSHTIWLPMDKWDACNTPVDHDALKGRPCFGGLDLSTTTDVSALVLLFPPYGDDPKWTAIPSFFLPEDAIEARCKRDRVPYDVWARQGLFHLTPGSVIDYDFIRARVNELGALFDIREIVFDRWNASQLTTQLTGDGFTMVELGQGFASLSAPTKRLLELVLSGDLAHGGNPVLRWMASNVMTATDPAGNIKPAKNLCRERIDGIAALIDALARASVVPLTPKSNWFAPQVW